MSVLTYDEARNILETLLSETIAGKLTWSEHENRKGRFDAATSNFTFAVLDIDKDELPPQRLVIWRRGAQQITDTIETDLEPDDDTTILNDVLDDIYHLALRKARGVENLSADILDDLRNLEDPRESF